MTDDPILKSLAELPPVPFDAAAADTIRRRARAELVEVGEARVARGRIEQVWAGAVLPGVLVAAGLAYTWVTVVAAQRIFLG